jgi:hypothetical protein
MEFPTLAELEAVENYVFASSRATLSRLQSKLGKSAELRVVVFASEYRPASQTCHLRHADMVFARTGIARVGTAPAQYRANVRGFLPQVEKDPFAVGVLPARYAAYLAVRRKGSAHDSIPMRFRGRRAIAAHWQMRKQVRTPDDARDFWIPVHKLFPGSECLLDVPELTVDFCCRHFNEKIYRVHALIGDALPPREYPYQFSEGIAEFSVESGHGTGLLMPQLHASLIEPARTRQGGWATFPVTEDRIEEDYSSFTANQETAGKLKIRSGPQYVNAKIEVDANGMLIDINADARYATLLERAKAGEYRALHFVDFSGDGWVSVNCPELDLRPEIAGGPRAAYSLVTAPDFYPLVDQRELTDWTNSRAVPKKWRRQIWGEMPPDTLSDVRLPANLQLPVAAAESPFDPQDDSMTALVPLLDRRPPPAPRLPEKSPARHSHLPDDAAGIFDPGWDVSIDRLGGKRRGRLHMAAYGLGSPFPEDVKLCAALSTFWPAASPDTTRLMEPVPEPGNLHTVCPLTDEEIGQLGDHPWDGVRGPRIVEWQGKQYAEFANLHTVDYVQNALQNQFSLRLTAELDRQDYQKRVIAMFLVHRTISPRRRDWNDWIVLSFRAVSPEGQEPGGPRDLALPDDRLELKAAQKSARTRLTGLIYRFEMIARLRGKKPRVASVAEYDFRKRLLPLTDRRFFFVSQERCTVLWRRAREVEWRARRIKR